MERLIVWFRERQAGSLSLDERTNSFVFAYDGGYLADGKAVPVSVSLPLREEPFDPYVSRKFFENLLPPEVVRRKLERVLHISVGNVFGCLKALGRDCAGAISVYPEGAAPEESGEERILELTDEEAESAILSLPQRPLLIDAYEGFRMSAAGAQDKIVARIRNGHLALPLFGAASTDILKPAVARLPESIANELFCQRLAQACGLDAAACDVLSFGKEKCYRTVRFDRYHVNGRVCRWHQEDFCQVLDLEPEQKYQDEGGPSVARCLRAIRDLRLGFAGQKKFLDYVIFNFLIGNADAHGKNFSLLYRDDSIDLAPLYDAMSTAVYDGAASRMAMRLGSAVSLSDVSRNSFRQLAKLCDIGEKIVLSELDGLTEKILSVAGELEGELSDRGLPSSVYGRVRRVISEQVKRTK